MVYASHSRWLWSEKQVQILKEAWPHWGTEKLAEILSLTEQQVKSKVDKLSLKMLPKKERKCISCDNGYQENRKYGLYCRECSLQKRKEHRKTIKKPTEIWMKELLRTIKYRSKEPCDVSILYMRNLWDLQNKKCFYTGKEMREPEFYGQGRAFNSASIDRIDPSRGYIMGNIVWCCWGCNIAKLDFSVDEFIENCSLIHENKFLIKENIEKLKCIEYIV